MEDGGWGGAGMVATCSHIQRPAPLTTPPQPPPPMAHSCSSLLTHADRMRGITMHLNNLTKQAAGPLRPPPPLWYGTLLFEWLPHQWDEAATHRRSSYWGCFICFVIHCCARSAVWLRGPSASSSADPNTVFFIYSAGREHFFCRQFCKPKCASLHKTAHVGIKCFLMRPPIPGAWVYAGLQHVKGI